MSPLEQARHREAQLAEGLRSLAKAHGIEFKSPLMIDSRGEFQLNVENPERLWSTSCGQYGEALAALITKHNPRCGVNPGAHIEAGAGWCRMHHFDVERMLKESGYLA